MSTHYRIQAAYNCDKVKNVTGQVPNTRAREKQGSADESIHAAKQRYRAARSALERLRGSGEWEATLHSLLDKDIVGLNQRALTREKLADNDRARDMGGAAEDDSVPLSGVISVGEGRRTLSWIWYTSDGDALHSNNDDLGLQDCKSLDYSRPFAPC